MQAARMALFLSLAGSTALGSWYLRVQVPRNQWRRPQEAGRQFMSQGRYGEAERLFATAVAAAHHWGEDDPRLALSLAQQADALVAQSRFDDAIPLFEQALAIHEKVCGPHHPDLDRVWERYAVPLRATGRIDRAEAAERRARIIQARSARGNPSQPPEIPRR